MNEIVITIIAVVMVIIFFNAFRVAKRANKRLDYILNELGIDEYEEQERIRLNWCYSENDLGRYIKIIALTNMYNLYEDRIEKLEKYIKNEKENRKKKYS